MSLATLKRKTEARYFPHSVEGVGFSLNGSTRFFGVGSILGRSVTRTPMRGEELSVGYAVFTEGEHIATTTMSIPSISYVQGS